MTKHVYFVPGLSANSKIFERLNLPKEQFECHFLEWFLPVSLNEPLEQYAQRMCALIKHKNPILIGVSFGGVLVQEMSKIITCERVVIISSIKTKYELPRKLQFIKNTKAYKLFPSKSIHKIENTLQFLFGTKAKKRIELYQNFLSVRNPQYLDWSIKTILNWKQTEPSKNILHIHGDRDEIFPIKHINNPIIIKKGSHVMIVTKATEIRRILIGNLS